MKLIDKAAVVAEIERLRRNQRLDDRHGQGVLDGLYAIERFLDTLEVKEVDLEKEMSEYFVEHPDEFFSDKYKLFAKHFFELGMQASNPLTWEDIANINDIVSEILKECKDIILYDTQESFCKEVLKRFKAQKGK